MAQGIIVITGKAQIQVKFTNKNQKLVVMHVPDAELSPKLREARKDAKVLAQLNGKEVVFEEVAGQPKRVRLPDEPASTAAVSSASTAAPAPAKAGGAASLAAQPAGQSAQREASGTRCHFHNPYNFVPAPPRNTTDPDLGDHPPEGHDTLAEGKYSGVIRVRIHCETPLLVVDAARAQQVNAEHNSYPVRLGVDGKPYLAPTSVKGMLRAAYEAVTNSRLSVFEGWDRRLAMRRAARIDVLPARVTKANQDRVEINILQQLWMQSPAKLPRYAAVARGDTRKGEQRAALRYGDGSLPQNLDHVWVRVSPKGYVNQIRKYQDPPSDKKGWQEGWVYITNPNINNKRSERVFVVSDTDRRLCFTGQEAHDIHRLWAALIKDYQEIHKKDLEARQRRHQRPDDYLGDEPGKTAWSRHVYERGAAQLKEGTLCYVSLQSDRITGLYPVAISRQLFAVSPLDLLPKELRPAQGLEQLSPADRVFGWVNQKGKGAYRGQLRVGPVACLVDNAVESFGMPGLPLAILGQPKPSQTRFYVAASRDGEAQGNGLSKEKAAYRQDKGLRGRKVYPHQRLPREHWENPLEDRTQHSGPGGYQEYRRPKKGGNEQLDDQNRSIQGWVKPGAEFAFDLYVHNLSAVELGALLWLLDLPEGHFHRLGGGKPLGFGSVRLTIDQQGTCLARGEEWKRFYENVCSEWSPSLSLAEPIAAFKQAVMRAYGKGQRTFESVPFIAAFLRAAQGFDDGLPVHYPRVGEPNQPNAPPPNVDGEGYQWFVENERLSGGQCKGLALPDLNRDRGLPVLAAPPRGGKAGGKAGGKGGGNRPGRPQ